MNVMRYVVKQDYSIRKCSGPVHDSRDRERVNYK